MRDKIFGDGKLMLGGLIAVVGFYASVGDGVDRSQIWAAQQFIVAAKEGVKLKAGTYAIEWWALFTAPVATVLGLAALLWVWRSKILLKSQIAADSVSAAQHAAQKALAEQVAAEAGAAAARDNLAAAQTDFEMQEAYDQMCEAVQRVVYKAYNADNAAEEPPPRIHFHSIDCIFEISATGDARVTQTYEIEAAVDFAKFLVLRLEADDLAHSFRTLRDIDFRATSASAEHDVEPLQIDNRGTGRSVAVFFLPEIPMGKRRKFVVTFSWPGWFDELVRTKSTDWDWSYLSAPSSAPVKVSYRFVFDSRLGVVRCENPRPEIPGQSLNRTDQDGKAVWLYNNPTNPSGRLNWKLRFKIS